MCLGTIVFSPDTGAQLQAAPVWFRMIPCPEVVQITPPARRGFHLSHHSSLWAQIPWYLPGPTHLIVSCRGESLEWLLLPPIYSDVVE